MNHNTIVRLLQIFNHVLLIFGIWYVFYTQEYYYLLISLLTYWTVGILGINIGFHRLLSHRSFKTYKWVEYIFSLVGTVTAVGSPLAWIALHRLHHRHVETDKDPHSPYQLGNWKAWFGLWKVNNINLKFIRDIRKNTFQKFLHKYYLWINIGYCFILWFINPLYVIFVYAIPACLVLHSTSTIIVIAHRHGYKNYELVTDQSRNSWIANIITMGEGWHNNHHAKPWKWNNSERWWEWDIPALIIKLIKI